jgi:aspartate/methionine/tyrosine aminotransferase
MRIEPFKMERMQSRYENYVDCNLSESGVHPMRVSELLEGDDRRRLFEAELGYSQSNGTEELRGRIAAFYDGAGVENVLVTNGGSEANFAAFWALLEPGDRVAYMLPNYLQTWGLARAFADRTDAFRLVRRRDGGAERWALDVAGLERAVGKRTRIILVTNPNNPTGAVLNEAEMDAVVRAARRVGATIVADEIYRGAEVAGSTTPTFWGRYDRVLITSGLSKAFGLPGLRIGWVVGPPKVVESLWSRRDYTTIAPGVLSDRLARVALEPARREAIFSRTRGIIRANLPVVEQWIRRRGNLLDHVPPQAGAIVFVAYHAGVRSSALAERLRVEHSVLICPGDQFGLDRYIRIGFGSDPEALRRGLQRLEPILDGLKPLRRAAAGPPAGRSRGRSPSRPAAARRPPG